MVGIVSCNKKKKLKTNPNNRQTKDLAVLPVSKEFMQQNYNGARNNENIQAVFTHLSVNIFLSFFVWVLLCYLTEPAFRKGRINSVIEIIK